MKNSRLKKQWRAFTLIKKFLVKLHWLLVNLVGLDGRVFIRFLKGINTYIKDWRAFRKGYSGLMRIMPCFNDRNEEGGSTKSEYFWQDLIVARWIFAAKPVRHVDIGSRVDGFVAHVASFREIEVFDVRPISKHIPGVLFRRADLMSNNKFEGSAVEGYCDSLSCLHALEHFGLGRYGDPVDPNGYARGLTNMAGMLQKGGVFYLSTPIGRARVEFNAHRVFDPQYLVQLAASLGLKLQQITIVNPDGRVLTAENTSSVLRELAVETYNLGIFIFVKE
jgi:hypothetical protein